MHTLKCVLACRLKRAVKAILPDISKYLPYER